MAPLSEDIAGIPHPNPTAMGPTTPTVPTLPLRRAVYIRVADLVRSFDIDTDKLRAEMAKLDAGEHEKKEGKVGRVDQENVNPAEKVQGSGEGGRSSEEAAAISLAGMNINDSAKNNVADEGQYPQKQFQQRLVPPSGGSNLCLLVGKVDLVVDKLRVDRSRVRLAEVEVGDETGTVSLRARDGQIDALKEISERSGAVVLRNCTMELYQGRHLRLAVTKWGKLSPYPDEVASTPPPPSKINRELNYSSVDLNSVVGEIKSHSPEASSTSSPGRHLPMSSSIQGQGRDVGLDEGISRGAGGGTPKQKRRGRDKKQQQFRQGPQGLPGHGPTFLPYPAMIPGISSFPPAVYPPSASVTDVAPYGYHVPPHLRDHGSEGQRQHHHHPMPPQHRDHHQKQQHLLLQQYELQQRHLEQMQLFQQQQERHRRMFESHGQQHPHQVHPSPPPAFMQDLHRVGSVESGSGQVILPPMGGTTNVGGIRDHPHSSPQRTTVPLHQRGAQSGEAHITDNSKIGPGERRMPASSTFAMSPYEEQFPPIQISQPRRMGSWHEQQGSSNPNISIPRMETPPASPGRMNPQAATFAPSQGKSQAPMHPPHHQHVQSPQYPYVPYESIQAQSAPMYGGSTLTHQQHAIFPQGGLYVPAFPGPDVDDAGPDQEPRDRRHSHATSETSGQVEFDASAGSSGRKESCSSKGTGTSRGEPSK